MDTLLTIEPGMIIWTFVAFGLVLFTLKKLAWKPLLKSLDDREQRIRGDLQKAEEHRVQSERLMEEHKRIHDNAEVEARRMIEEARKTAEALKTDVVEKAEEQARQMVTQAKAEIQREKETALAQLRNEVADLAVLAASKILDEALDEERHKKLVNAFIADLQKN